MKAITRYWRSHGTRILATLTMICAGIPLINNLVPEAHQPYWQAVNLVLGAITFQRGTTNARNNPPPASGG
jgi:hypothetical protein